MDKDYFRKKIKKSRNLMRIEERRTESEIVCKKLLELKKYKEAKKIMSFMNFGSELEIELFNKRVIFDGKELYLPKVEKDGTLSVVRYSGDFSIGAFGIREPLGGRYQGDLDLIITPGLVFDRVGNRIGYGKGYYDKLFSKYNRVLKIAPIFEIQLFDKIPCEEHDIKIDMIITKNDILKIKNY